MIENERLSLKLPDVRNKIRSLYVEGKNIKEIQAILDIACGTWDNAYYLNHHGFRDFMTELKKEYFLKATERVSREILDMDTTENAKMLAIKQKESEFLRETILKEHGYTKRIETFGVNVNKNEPLDDEQKEKLDRLVKTAGNKTIKDVEVVNGGSVEPL